MGIRTSVELIIAAGLNNSLDDTVFDRTKTELLDTMKRAKSTTVQVPANTVDQQISFDGIAIARLIYIEAKAEISFKLNGTGTTAISLKRMAAPTSTQAPNLCAYALMTCEATALYLSNASLTDAVDVTVCIVGDII